MAEKQANLIVRLKDELTGPLNKVKGAIGNLHSAYLGVVAAITSATVTIYQSIKAYAENESAVNKLNAALLKQGITSNQVSLDLQAYAQQLQRTTVYSDETIMRAQALMVTFGLTGDTLKRTTKAAMDLSTTLGVDLQTASMLLGKAYAGNTTMLQRYGIMVDQTKSSQDRFLQALTQIEEMMGGASQAAAATFSGRLQILNNQIDELQETIGQVFMPVAEKMVTFFLNLAVNTKSAIEGFGMFGTVAAVAIEGIRTFINVLFDTMQKIPGASLIWRESFQKNINDVIDSALAKLQQLHQESAKPIPATITATGVAPGIPGGEMGGEDKAIEKAKQKLLEQGYQELEDFTTKKQAKEALAIEFENAEIARLQNNLSIKEQMELMHLINLEQMNGQYDLARQIKEKALVSASVKMKQDEAKMEKEIQEKRKKDFTDTIDNLAELQKSKFKEMQAIGKAAALIQIFMKTREGAISAYAAMAGIPLVGPALGIAAAAAITAYGLEQAAAVSGLQLAEGGIVLPRAGGVQATLAEAGRPEAVIPLDEEETTSQIGGTHIHFEIGTLIADDSSLDQLAARIDEKLYQLQRRGRSLSFS